MPSTQVDHHHDVLGLSPCWQLFFQTWSLVGLFIVEQKLMFCT